MNDSEANPEAVGGDERPVNSDVADDEEDENNVDGDTLADADVFDLLDLAAGARDSSGQGGAGGSSQRAASNGISTMHTSSSDEHRDINDGDAADPSPTEGSPAPPSNQALVDDFLHWHETWTSYDKVLNQLESWGMDSSRYKDIRVVRTPLKFVYDRLESEERGDDPPSRLAVKVNGANDLDDRKMPRLNHGDAPSSSIALEELSGVLFRPGMKFRGRIFIPGMGNHKDSGDTYELIVREQRKDAMGNFFILATHRAYNDEQAVHIQINIRGNVLDKQKDESKDASRWLEVEYADGETVCIGKWNPNKFCLEGHVKQRMQVNDCFFHTDAVTHVFTLYPCTRTFLMGREHMDEARCLVELGSVFLQKATQRSFEQDILSKETRALAAHRNRTHTSLVESLRSYSKAFEHLNLTGNDVGDLIRYNGEGIEGTSLNELLNEKQRMLIKFCDVNWAEMFAEACTLGEVLCAEFRRRASILTSLSFETFEDRRKHIDKWKSSKMDLESTHAEWDGYIEILHSVFTGAFVFAAPSSTPKHLRMSNIRDRLAVSFECFESAYRSSCVRLPKSYVKRFEKPHMLQHELDDCIICQSSLLDTMGDAEAEVSSSVYQLPCSHCFHEKCLHQWLHDHSSCPVCRFDLR